MSSSSPGFEAGLAFMALGPVEASSGPVTAAPFSVPRGPAEPAGQFEPMVFRPFDGRGAIVSLADSDEPAAEAADAGEAFADVEPLPPPDFAALAAAARQEGFQLGYQEGLRQAAAEQRDLGTRLSALLQGVAADNEALIRGLEAQVVELALAIAEKVIAREARTDPEIVLGVVRSALAEISDAAALRIRVNPEDAPLLDGRWQEMLPRSVAESSELVPDEQVERGGVVVETRIGQADGQLRTRLSQVMTTFQAVLDGEPV